MNRFIHITTALIITLSSLFFAAMPVAAQDDGTNTYNHRNHMVRCHFPEGTIYAGHDVFGRYNASDARVELVSWNTGDILNVIETDIVSEQFDVRGWSSDCRFMIASDGPWTMQQTIAYDVYENRRSGHIGGCLEYGVPLNFAPEGYKLVAQTLAGTFYWDLLTNNQVIIAGDADASGRAFVSTEWDMHNRYFLGVHRLSTYGLSVYDMADGEQLALLTNGENTRPMYQLSVDGANMLIIGTVAELGTNASITVWNLDNLQATTLDNAILYGGAGLTANYANGTLTVGTNTWTIG